MNKQYNYPGIEEWYQPPKAVEAPAIQYLIDKILTLPEDRMGVDEKEAYKADQEAIKKLPDYHYKTGCYDDPELVKALAARNIAYATLEMGAVRWIVLTPTAPKDPEAKRPLILTFHAEDYYDVFWNQKTLDIYSSMVDALEEKQDRTLIFLVAHIGSKIAMFQGQITEGIQNYGADKERIYVNLTNFLAKGEKLNDIEDFKYPLLDGSIAEDADAYIEEYDGIPVLNFSKRWVSKWRSHPLNGATDGSVDLDWQIHSEFGRKMLEKNHINMQFELCTDQAVIDYWKEKGLNYGCHYIKDERWIIFTPTQTSMDKLPVVVCLQEVNEPNDHAPIQAYAEYKEYCDIASQGDCAVIFFAMESPELNDLIADIVKDAAKMYPIDLSRVYMTGHSHNGHFTQEFARRNPKVVAAIAPLGNAPGLPDPSVSHEAVAVDDARAAVMETMDMPTCILCGCGEVGGMVPINQTAHAFETGINVEGYAASAEGKIAMWLRRLKAERVPVPTAEEVADAADSPKKAIRALGFPCEKSEIVYIDGFEHYIGDIKNVDGNFHFRVVAIQNTPHMVTPSMNMCAWNYMKKFARNLETGEVIELE